MGKRILIIDSGRTSRDFFGLVLARWAETDAQISIWSDNKSLIALARERKWKRLACPELSLLTVNLAQKLKIYLLKLRLLKSSLPQSYDTIIMYNWPEKIWLSRLVKRLNIRLIWLEDGATDYDRLAHHLRLRLLNNSSSAKVLAINEELIGNLTNLGYDPESLRLIPDCTMPEPAALDATHNLARHFKLRKDYFTICAKLDWQKVHIAESLIKALQLCLDVSPHFQLVLMGDGPAREQIRWLIKRYHLDTQVWLVGDRPQNERSLEGFGAFVIADRRPDWDDAVLAVTAMAHGIPVLARPHTILEEVLKQELGRTVEMDDNQELAQAWLALYHKPITVSEQQKRNFTKQLVSFEALADKLLAII